MRLHCGLIQSYSLKCLQTLSNLMQFISNSPALKIERISNKKKCIFCMIIINTQAKTANSHPVCCGDSNFMSFFRTLKQLLNIDY